VRNQLKNETHPIWAGWASGNLPALPAPRRPPTTTQDNRRGAEIHTRARIRGRRNWVKPAGRPRAARSDWL